MEKLLKEIREIIKENKAHLEGLPAKDRAVWVLLSIANSSAFRENSPKCSDEDFLTERDPLDGYIYKVSVWIKKLLKEEGL
jgi:hypothetical protein